MKRNESVAEISVLLISDLGGHSWADTVRELICTPSSGADDRRFCKAFQSGSKHRPEDAIGSATCVRRERQALSPVRIERDR